MADQICPMLARSDWGVGSTHAKGVSHQLCSTQSSVGLASGRTGAWLVFLNGCHRGEDARLAMGTTNIGSSWTSDLVLTAPEISSHHATFVVSEGSATVVPSSASRSVRVNGESVNQVQTLHDGDMLSFAELHAVIRFAKLFTPGYRPVVRPRPQMAPPVGGDSGSKTFTAGWLVAASGAQQGRDWRLVKGQNRMGSALGLEITWLEGNLPPEICVISCDLKACKLERWDQSLRLLINGAPAKVGHELKDSDRVQINRMEFYLKCL